MVSPDILGCGGTSNGFAAELASSHAVLAGRINVAICPGPDLAAITASAPSLAMSFDDFDVLTQEDTGFAIPSISAVKGASYST